MVSEQPTRKVLKLLMDAGWQPAAGFVGSHRKWKSPDGSQTISIPEGHKTISPGIVRQVLKAIQEGMK